MDARAYKILGARGFTRSQIDKMLSISDSELLSLPHGVRAVYEYAYQLLI